MQKKASTLSLKENYRERALEKNYSFTLKESTIRGQILFGPRLIREMSENHELGPLETLLLGHSYFGALIMAANLKEEGRVQIQVDCEGPLSGLSVEADNHGAVRGYLHKNPIPVKEQEELQIPALFGPGVLTVTRLDETRKQPHSSKINLNHGNIGKDLAQYYLESEQIPSFFHLSIHFDKEGKVLGAGALFLQVMPGAKEEDILELEQRALKLPSIGQSFSEGQQPEDFLQQYFGDMGIKMMKKTPIEFFCPCNKDRFSKFLEQLGDKDKKEILQGEELPLKLNCHNCNSNYFFEKQELQTLFQKS